MDSPAAEVDIDEALIEALVLSQHPDLAGPVRIVARGWDNVVARLGDAHVVRIPRRSAGAPLIENEARWLPFLAERLPVRVPAAVRMGRPEFDFPWNWLICPWVEGVPVTSLAVPDRRQLAADLGAAHAALHVAAPSDAPINDVRGVPLASRAAVVEQRLSSGVVPRSSDLRASFARALAAPEWSAPAVWLHGDPHPGNLLATTADASARLAALIDFGDITSGDPATDLAIAWLAFDAEGRRAYRDAHHAITSIDDDTWIRAHGWAVSLTAVFVMSSDDLPEMAAIGRHALEQVLADPPM